MKIVRFKGKFTDLIPAGWTFQKLFARNYRQYHKTCDGEKYSQGCRIWQHHGGYLEISDLSIEMSAVFAQKIIDGKIDEWASQVVNLYDQTKKDTVFWFIIDQQKKQFLPYHSKEYRSVKQEEFLLVEAEVNEKNREKLYVHLDHYRSWNARPELIEMVKDLVSRGWIGVDTE